jgi:hypothetical protein
MNHELTLEDQQTCVVFYSCGHIEQSLLKYHNYYFLGLIIFTILSGFSCKRNDKPKMSLDFNLHNHMFFYSQPSHYYKLCGQKCNNNNFNTNWL